jgi:hypothetical protein
MTLLRTRLAVCSVIAVAALAGCGARPTQNALSSGTPSPSRSSAQSPASAYRLDFLDVTVTPTRSGPYLSWTTGTSSEWPRVAHLARFVASTGLIEASRSFSQAFVSAPVAAAGWLWIISGVRNSVWLLRLNPLTLATTGRLRLTDRYSGWFVGPSAHITFAGGAIWTTGSGQLIQVTPGSMTISRRIPLTGADSTGVGASPDGHVLIVSEAHYGAGTIQRRDPATGALLASRPVFGVTAAGIEAVTDSGVWMSVPTGMLGYIERFTTASLAPQPATAVHGTNAIHAFLADGSLWVVSPGSGIRLNYCADQVTGHPIASIPLPDYQQDSVTAVASAGLFYLDPEFHLTRSSVPSACMR